MHVQLLKCLIIVPVERVKKRNHFASTSYHCTCKSCKDGIFSVLSSVDDLLAVLFLLLTTEKMVPSVFCMETLLNL
jgi:hypothetical protein